MINEDTIKTIILEVKLTNNIELNSAIEVIKAYIFDKKQIDLDDRQIEVTPFDVNGVINAFQYAAYYFEKKFGMNILYKKHQTPETKPIIINAWF